MTVPAPYLEPRNITVPGLETPVVGTFRGDSQVITGKLIFGDKSRITQIEVGFQNIGVF
jgi:hypothetical protein